MDDFKYSVLMSVYAKENPEHLKLAIESIMNQTLKPSQIVVVKDGPLTSELDLVLNNFIKKHKGLFKVIKIKNNVGLGKALNEGLNSCEYPYIARMDSDDISLPKRCEKQIERFKKRNNLSVVGTWIDEFYDEVTNVVTRREVPLTHEAIKKFSKRRSPFNHPTVMYKKEDVLAVGGYRELEKSQDFDLFVRMIDNNFICENIGESLLLYRTNVNNFKRRKTLKKCSGNIKLMYSFWKMGHSSFFDFILVSLLNVLAFITPTWIFSKMANTFLRKKVNS